jgi:SAM-dependent methyltransferase/uncharacterized protein YbaR (Trm112 family)
LTLLSALLSYLWPSSRRDQFCGMDIMKTLIDERILELIICPNCDKDLKPSGEQLKCSSCSSIYDVVDGIPLLYPNSVDKEHLAEEEKLAEMMKMPRATSKDRFSSAQWALSKQEFWHWVAEAFHRKKRATFVNIGCGYDTGFKELESQGHTFINFDMVPLMLTTLQKEVKAKTCVAGDVNRLPFAKGKFDCVISIDVIHHETRQLDRILASFRDLLRPGGVLFLEDPNAWGLFQMPKSILLPRPLHRFLRSTYHRVRGSLHRPADYEFSTSVWYVISELKRLGFKGINVHPNFAYPCIGPVNHSIYKALSRSQYITKYHNFHYLLSATKN